MLSTVIITESKTYFVSDTNAVSLANEFVYLVSIYLNYINRIYYNAIM